MCKSKKLLYLAISLMLVVACMAAFSVTGHANDVRYTTANVNLRSGPGTEWGVLVVVPRGTQLYAEEASYSWTQVNYGGYTGFVSNSYLSAVDPGAAPAVPSTPVMGNIQASTVWTQSQGCNLRSGPSTDYGIVCVLPGNVPLTTSSYGGGWYYVYYGNYAQGYVSASVVRNSEYGSSSGSSGTGKSNIVYAGNQVLTSHDFTQMYATSDTSTVLDTLCAGTRLIVLGYGNGWYQVSNNGVNGWIPASDLCKYLGGPALTTS